MCHDIYPVYQGIFEGQVRPSIRAMIRKGSHGALHRLPGHERWGVMGWPGSPSWSVSGTQHLVYHNWNVCDLYIDWSIYITFLFLSFYLYRSIHLWFVSLSCFIYLLIYVFFCFIFLYFFLSSLISIFILSFLSFFLSIFLYFYLSFYLSLFLSFFLYFSVSFCL